MEKKILDIIKSCALELDFQVLPYEMLKKGARRIGNDCIYVNALLDELDIQTFSNWDMEKIIIALQGKLKNANCCLEKKRTIKSNHIIFKIVS